jgi:hypothetical protein
MRHGGVGALSVSRIECFGPNLPFNLYVRCRTNGLREPS